MACFAVPGAEAIVATAVMIAVKKHESRLAAPSTGGAKVPQAENKTPFSKKLGWLCSLLWGGVALLAFEHIWHGEVVPFPPFLTATADPVSKAEMLHEMATSGVAMAVLVTLIWVGMVIVSSVLESKSHSAVKAEGKV